MRKPLLTICLFWSLLSTLPAQDFILQGCYWSCPEDAPGSLPDSATLSFWVDHLTEQAPEFAHAGFTAIWLPNLTAQAPKQVQKLIQGLEDQGLTVIAEVDLGSDSLGTFSEQGMALNDSLGVASFSVTDRALYPAEAFVADQKTLLDHGLEPKFIIRGVPDFDHSGHQIEWMLSALKTAGEITKPTPRIYDYPLREALRKACTDSTYDVRKVYQASIRDATALSGYNIVTMANHPAYKNQNAKAGDYDDPMADPLLAYAYLLTNNQIGMPTVFYGDYFGGDSELAEYEDRKPLRTHIDQLLATHQQFIFNSTIVEYLNAYESDKRAYWLSGDSTRALIFQLEGISTPAGIKSRSQGAKDVVVAINFGKDTLLLKQELNTSNIKDGDYFTDVSGHALAPKATLTKFDSLDKTGSAVVLQLPPRSYGIWVQGRAKTIKPSRIKLTAGPYPDYIELNWTVAYERKVMGYQIERAVNGGPFQQIGQLHPLANENEPASFLYLDKDIYPEEDLRYRVKLVDMEGKHEFSPVAHTKPAKRDLKFELIETPKRHTYAFKMQSNYSGEGELIIYNASGNPVFEQPKSIKKGENVTKVDLSRLEKGIYYLRFHTEKQAIWSTKVVRL
jgi:hypothetical protein